MSAGSPYNVSDTIAAISTPPGEGGVGMVRLSGPESLAIAARLFQSSRGHDIQATRGWRSYHGHVARGGAVLDEVLAHVMRAPRTYTREDVVELCGHGGAGPMNAILEACLAEGARLAAPGEFTLRAFLNGRIDLVQAEAVLDQIHARTEAGLQAAMAASKGALSAALHGMKGRLREALARIEAAVDFPEDDLPALITPELVRGLQQVRDEMRALLATAHAGRLYREGVTVTIAGRPNVGKSSLFNALLRDARAIVSAHAGTTRDRIEEYINLRGAPVRLIDTAGLRETTEEVERFGIALAREAMREAQAVLFVADASAGFQEEDAVLMKEAAALSAPMVLVWNKADLAAGGETAEATALPVEPASVCRVSALTNAGISELEEQLGALLLGGLNQDASQPMLTRLRQKNSLQRAEECVARLLENTGRSPEFLALDLQEALDALGEITGETTPDDVLGAIFANFCIGK